MDVNVKKKIGISLLGLCLVVNCYAMPISNHLTKEQLIQAFLRDMVFVKGGTFTMWYPPQNPNGKVTLSSYYLDRYSTPWYQLKSYLNLIHKKLPIVADVDFNNESFSRFNGIYPAQASYPQAQAFCHWIGKQIGLPVTLVTEAQWEYAARDRGKNILYSTNNGKLEPGKNYPFTLEYVNAFKVNKMPPNPLGIYMMNGNGMEWVKDYYGDIPSSPVTNPQGPMTGKDRTLRGTDVDDSALALDPHEAKYLRDENARLPTVYNRTNMSPDIAANFRCAINTDNPLPKKFWQ